MNIFEIAEAVRTAEAHIAKTCNHSFLIYGRARTGKTRLAGTIAKVLSVGEVHWFDLENGKDTLVSMARRGELTPEQAKKIHLYQVKDTPSTPIAMDTILNCLVVGKPVYLCLAHGRRDCPECLKIDKTKADLKVWHPVFDITKLTSKDWIVVDTGTQLGISCLAYLMKGIGYDVKPGWDEFGPQGRMLSDITSVMQAAVYCNFILITHQMILDEKDKFLEGKMISDQETQAQFGGIYPLMGTKNFSVNVASKFGNIIYCEINKLRKHVAGSSTTYKSDVVTGSRMGIRIEDESQMDLSLVFAKLGLYGATTPSQEQTNK